MLPHVVDMRVRLVQEAPGKKTDNVLYYFTPEEIVSIEKVDTSSPTVQRRALHMMFGESVSTKDIVAEGERDVKDTEPDYGLPGPEEDTDVQGGAEPGGRHPGRERGAAYRTQQ